MHPYQRKFEKYFALRGIWDTLSLVSRQKPAVQMTMQRFQFTRSLFELTDQIDSPGKDGVPEPNKVVPDSFAEWLARPSQTITPEPQSEQGIFAGLMNECLVRTIAGQSLRRRC